MSINEKVLEIIEEVPEGHFLFVENIDTGESNWSEDAVEYFGFF